MTELGPIFQNSARVTQNHQRITINRNSPLHIPLSGEFLNGQIRATSLEFGTVSFDLDRQAHTASNIQGISLHINVFGMPHNLAIQRASIATDENGQRVLRAAFANPLPEQAERIIGMPNHFIVDFPIVHGAVTRPRLSTVFERAAQTTGPSIAGLLAADVLREGSRAAYFVETNTEWADGIIGPALQEIYRLLADESNPGPDRPNLAVPGRPNPTSPMGDATVSGRTQAVNRPIDSVNRPGDHTLTMTVGGVERSYTVHVPPSYDGRTPMPMVLLLHGHGQDGAEIARETRMNQVADQRGFIAVYPNARSWAGRTQWRAWDTDNGLVPPGSHAADVSFLRNIIENAQRDLAIDGRRIFMVGMSNGGMMTFRAAGELSDKLAAIAVISGAMGGGEPSPRFPLSVLNIHGTADNLVPYNGLRNVPDSLTAIGLPRFQSMEYATNYWVEQNRITMAPLVVRNNNVTERRFVNPANGVEVTECTISGGEHIPDNFDELTTRIWQFFQAHPKASGEASGTPQARLPEPFNITERIMAHARARGVHGLEIDFGRMLTEIPSVADGDCSPSRVMRDIESRTGVSLNDGVSSVVKHVAEVSKRGARISIAFDEPRTFSINQSAGPVTINSVNVGRVSFNLHSVDRLPSITDISGVSVGLNALGSDFDVPVRTASQHLDAQGVPYYRITTDNPLPAWARVVLCADRQIPVELAIDNDAAPYLRNRPQLLDSAIGVNPVSRGYIDTIGHAVNMWQNPSWGGALHVAKDSALYAGCAWGGYRLAALRWGTRGRVGAAIALGTLLAPTIVHGVERLIG